MHLEKDVVIIGAGASGLMCASIIKNIDFIIIEQNSEVGKKISISGGGKCNVTNRNVSYDNYLGDKDFVKPVLDAFNNRDLLNFFKDRDLTFIERKKDQYFCKQSANEILDVFKSEIKKEKINRSKKVLDITKNGNFFFIKTDVNIIKAKKVVVATGGKSYESVGGGEFAYQIAKKFGHNIKTINPALVGFTVQKDQFWFKNLSGISFRVKVSVRDKIFIDEILFAHKGISGPVILNASLYWEKGQMSLDFIPEFDLLKIDKKSQKQISSILPLPKRFIKEFLTSISLDDKQFSKITKDEFEKLLTLKNYIFSPAGNFGFSKAEVTKGGIDTNEINNKNMESKLVKNLFFIGECLDVTGELGGYNFQWAFSSAIRCANDL